MPPPPRPAGTAFEVHRRFLADHVRPGDRVLEVGAGPGRFTVALAEMGAKVVVTDVSPVQLELNEQHVSEAGVGDAAKDRFLLDIRDTARFGDREFDLALAYGGPLSYVFEDAQNALTGLLRISRVTVASVMSTLGSWRFFLPGVVDQVATIGVAANDLILETGDLRHDGKAEGHTCQMYRYREVADLVTNDGSGLVPTEQGG